MRPAIKKLYFCFPFKGVGGVSVLFVRVAEFLASSGLAKCFLIDYSDGHMSNLRDPRLTEFIEYSDSEDIFIPDDAIVIFQSMTPWSIFPNIKMGKKTKLLFWNCHPLNLIPSMPGFRHLTASTTFLSKLILNTLLISFKLKSRNFLKLLERSKAILFMDGNNLNLSSELLKVKLSKPSFLPIPAKASSKFRWNKTLFKNSKSINFLWIGRIVDFKYFPLKRFLADLTEIQILKKIPVTLTVIGKGKFFDKFYEHATQNENVQLRFKDHIDLYDLDKFILENADIMVAMGTSALEGAKLGVPTLLMDFSYKEIRGNYNYRWVHETEDYNLGCLINERNNKNNERTLLNKISEFQKSADSISLKELDYFEKNHNLSSVSNQLLDFISESNCFFEELDSLRVFKKPLIYKFFYSIRKKILKNNFRSP